MKWKSRFARCAMFAVAPVRRLSIPMTVCPRSSSVSERCDPMNPAAPVMTILDIGLYSFQLPAASFQLETEMCALDGSELSVGSCAIARPDERFHSWKLEAGSWELIRMLLQPPQHREPHDLDVEP